MLYYQIFNQFYQCVWCAPSRKKGNCHIHYVSELSETFPFLTFQVSVFLKQKQSHDHYVFLSLPFGGAANHWLGTNTPNYKTVK